MLYRLGWDRVLRKVFPQTPDFSCITSKDWELVVDLRKHSLYEANAYFRALRALHEQPQLIASMGWLFYQHRTRFRPEVYFTVAATQVVGKEGHTQETSRTLCHYSYTTGGEVLRSLRLMRSLIHARRYGGWVLGGPYRRTNSRMGYNGIIASMGGAGGPLEVRCPGGVVSWGPAVKTIVHKAEPYFGSLDWDCLVEGGHETSWKFIDAQLQVLSGINLQMREEQMSPKNDQYIIETKHLGMSLLQLKKRLASFKKEERLW